MCKQFIYLILLFTILWIKAFGQIPDGYYDGTEKISGIELKNRLHEIIRNHIKFPYTSANTDVWDILKETDKDPENKDNVILFYTGWSINADQEYNDRNGWIREHVWAKSHGDFGTNIGPGTDVHAIRPCDISVNEKRSNLDFALGGEIYIDLDGTTNCRYTSDSWEPADDFKGDVARMIFYMAVRYEGTDGEPDLEVVDDVNSSPNHQALHGKLSDLLKWNESDPPNDFERKRNDIIYYKYQHNRNPFIDHPEFANRVFGGMDLVYKPDSLKMFAVFPNPVKDTITIKINNQKYPVKKFKFILSDYKGKTVYKFRPDSNLVKIQCKDLKRGIYMLKLKYKRKLIESVNIIKE